MQIFHPQQAFFPEVLSPDEHSSAVSTWEETLNRRETRKSQGRRYCTLRREQLDAPLLKHLDAKGGVAKPTRNAFSKAARLLDNGERDSWSEKAMIDMHEALLLGSLNAFRCRGNPEEKADVLRWIFDEPHRHGTIRVEGQELAVFGDEVPFSFDSCCRYVGVDPEKLRDAIGVLIDTQAMSGVAQ